MKTLKKLRILIIAGASGVGKGEQIKRLVKKYPHLFYFSISVTTRPPGENEVHGRDYFFVSLEEFNRMEKEGLFVETNPYATSHRYGTLKSEIEKAFSLGKIVLFDVEINGALGIFNQYPDETLIIFLDASEEASLKRLNNPNTRKRDNIPGRIANIAEQRAKAYASENVLYLVDTSNMEIPKVFERVDALFDAEVSFRNSAKVIDPVLS